MANILNSNGLDVTNGDVRTSAACLNSSRQVLRCKSGSIITIKYPSSTMNLGGNILAFALDDIRIFMSYIPYSVGTYDKNLNLIYGADIKAYFNLTISSVNNSDGTTTLTLARKNGTAFSEQSYIQVEYTAGATTVTLS